MRQAIAAATLLALATAGCAGKSHEKPSVDGRDVNTLEARLTLPEGYSINSVHYQVTGNGVDPGEREGDIDVTNSSSLRFRVGDLAVANDYTMTLTANTAGTPSFSCAGEALFDIDDNDVSFLTMTLTCGGGVSYQTDPNGDISVTVNVVQGAGTICPVVTGISALPLETAVGSNLQLTGYSSSAPTSVLWSGAGGTFVTPAAASTAFTCGTPGLHELTFTVSKTGCENRDYSVEVECTGVGMPAEICDNTTDDDGDTQIDCMDSDCVAFPACVPTPVEDCDNTTDDDGDGLIDCLDTADCATAPNCVPTPVEDCDNTTDDDGDGLIDCLDTADCATAPNCVPTPVEDCDNTTDDDGDGLIDCLDTADCAADPFCAPPPNACLECINTQCSNYQGANLADPCLNGSTTGVLGETLAQPAFGDACAAALNCSIFEAASTMCAENPSGPFQCYCGNQTIDACNATGPLAGAVCVSEWEGATQCPAGDFTCVGSNFTDLTRPSGYVTYIIECANAGCAAECFN